MFQVDSNGTLVITNTVSEYSGTYKCTADNGVGSKVARAKLQVLGECNFETDLCFWTQAKDEVFDWTRKSGGTSSSDTGPSTDHTIGKISTGQFCYHCVTL